MLWTLIIYKLYQKTTKILSRIKKTLTTNKKLPINISRSWYTRPLIIFLPKIKKSHSNKENVLVVEYLDTLLANVQNNQTSKLFPITNSIRLKRINSPKRLTRKETLQKISQKKPQLTLIQMRQKRRIFPKVTRNYIQLTQNFQHNGQ